MQIKVEQTKAGRRSQYEIKVNGELKYLVGDSQTNIVVPFRVIGDADPGTFTDTKDHINSAAAYDYSMVEQISDPEGGTGKVFCVRQKGSKGKVYDESGEICGRFHKVKKGTLDSNFIIEYGDCSLSCYDISAGKTRNISIFKDDVQVAAIIKPLNTVDNLDEYYIFLLDEYSELDGIISLFAVFFDFRYYSNRGEKAASKKAVSVSYSFDKNNKRYNKNWIADNFGEEAVNAVNEEIRQNRASISKGIKKQAKYIILFFILCWLAVFIAWGIWYFF